MTTAKNTTVVKHCQSIMGFVSPAILKGILLCLVHFSVYKMYKYHVHTTQYTRKPYGSIFNEISHRHGSEDLRKKQVLDVNFLFAEGLMESNISKFNPILPPGLSHCTNSSKLSVECSQVLNVMLLQAPPHIIFIWILVFAKKTNERKITSGKLLYMGGRALV